MKNFNGLTLLRISVAIIFITHAIRRMTIEGAVSGFGSFLDSQSLAPLGVYLAWGITLYELIGGLILIQGSYKRMAALLFIIHQLGGITMVHFKEGWFVVGAGRNGAEYSFLLIAALLAIAFPEKFERRLF